MVSAVLHRSLVREFIDAAMLPSYTYARDVYGVFVMSFAAEGAMAELNISNITPAVEELKLKSSKGLTRRKKETDGASSKKKLQEEVSKKCVKIGIKFRKQSSSVNQGWNVLESSEECVAHQLATMKVCKGSYVV